MDRRQELWIKTRRHVNNLRKTLPDEAKQGPEYQYIITHEQLMDRILLGLDDDGYPMRVEPKRDRFVMNSKAMEKAIDKIVKDTLNEISGEVVAWIQTDVRDYIASTTENVLNNLTINNNVATVKPSPMEKKAIRLGDKFGKVLAKAIMNGVKELF